MPRSENQKFKILYLMQMLLERTDGSHIITMQEILAELERHGVAAERKSIYHDIGTLRQFGMDVPMRPVDKDTFRVKLPVVPGPQFYGWLAGPWQGRPVRVAAGRGGELPEIFKTSAERKQITGGSKVCFL